MFFLRLVAFEVKETEMFIHYVQLKFFFFFWVWWLIIWSWTFFTLHTSSCPVQGHSWSSNYCLMAT